MQQRLFWLFLRWFLLFILVSAIAVGFVLSEVRDRLSSDEEQLARTVAAYVDTALGGLLHDLERLEAEIAVDEPAGRRLRAFRLRALFRDAVFLVDDEGRVLASDPDVAELPDVAWLRGARSHTGFLSRETPPALVAIASFDRRGRKYALVAESRLPGSGLSLILQDLVVDRGLHVAVVDSGGRIVAAPDQRQIHRVVEPVRAHAGRIAAGRPVVAEAIGCGVCPEESSSSDPYLTIMVPLEVAPWTLVLQLRESTLGSLIETFRVDLAGALVVLVVMGLLLSRSFSRSVVAPIRDLSVQAQRLRQGDLRSPIQTEGDREIQVLASSLDEARRRIAESLGRAREVNEQLEELVDRRTEELRTRIDDLRILLDVSKLSSQERDPEVFIPEILRLVSRRFGTSPVALVVTQGDTERRVYFEPAGVEPAWLRRGESPPDDWTIRPLVHLGQKQGELALGRPTGSSEPVLDALQNELAGALHAAGLLRRILTNNERRRELVRRLLTAGEEERRRIARELHDEISQLLTVIQLSLERVVGGDEQEVQRTQQLLTRTQEEIHRIIYDLRPSLLDDLGLAAAVKWYAAGGAAQGIAVQLEVEDELELPEEVEITAFRILQECMTNILRHAQAQNASIELYRSDGHLVLIVEDDGVGFDVGRESRGSGLLGMRERAALVGGVVEVDSEPGAGTTIQVTLPLEGQE